MNDKFDRFNKQQYSQQDRLSIMSEAMLLPKSNFVASAKVTTKDKTSEQSAIFGLGIISILLLAGGVQLQRSINLISRETNNTQTERQSSAALSVPSDVFTQQNPEQYNFYNPAIENAIKNSISHGKF